MRHSEIIYEIKQQRENFKTLMNNIIESYSKGQIVSDETIDNTNLKDYQRQILKDTLVKISQGFQKHIKELENEIKAKDSIIEAKNQALTEAQTETKKDILKINQLEKEQANVIKAATPYIEYGFEAKTAEDAVNFLVDYIKKKALIPITKEEWDNDWSKRLKKEDALEKLTNTIETKLLKMDSLLTSTAEEKKKLIDFIKSNIPSISCWHVKMLVCNAEFKLEEEGSRGTPQQVSQMLRMVFKYFLTN